VLISCCSESRQTRKIQLASFAWLFRIKVKLYRARALITPGHLSIARTSRLLSGSKIIWRHGRVDLGENIKLRHGVVIDAQRGSIKIGDNVSLNEYTIVLGRGGVEIGNDVRIAAQVLFASFDHNFDDVSQPIRKQGITSKPIIIEDDVWIGAGAKILGGSHVAKGCVIGANAVVKGDTVPYGVYVGIPARLLKLRGQPESAKAPIVPLPKRR